MRNDLSGRGERIKIKGIPREEREKGIESLFKVIIAENLPNLGKELDFTSP